MLCSFTCKAVIEILCNGRLTVDFFFLLNNVFIKHAPAAHRRPLSFLFLSLLTVSSRSCRAALCIDLRDVRFSLVLEFFLSFSEIYIYGDTQKMHSSLLHLFVYNYMSWTVKLLLN